MVNLEKDVIALHQADCDMKKELIEKNASGEGSLESLIEQEALIGQIFKQGMTEIWEKANGITEQPE